MIFLRNLEDLLRNLGILSEFLERNLEHFLRYLYLGLVTHQGSCLEVSHDQELRH